MYCTNCGLKQSGNFCAGCGNKLTAPQEILPIVPTGDWRREIRYDVLIKFPEVRDRLAAVRECEAAMTGEEWLELYDKAFKPFAGVSAKTIAAIATPISAQLGIKTGQTRMKVIPKPPGQVIVDLLCALAGNGLPLKKVHQGETGCVFEAKLPSDLWAVEGKIIVTVERFGPMAKVTAATNIPGQLFDFGKSTRCLDKLFGDLLANEAA